MSAPSELEDFFFDLNGFLVVQGALAESEREELNAAFDGFPRDLERGGWIANAQRRDYNAQTGFELHNCLDAGPAFDVLIDHESWVGHARHYAGEEGSYLEGLFIDECIASIRGPGGHHPVHSGGYRSSARTQYRFDHGVFRCGQLNVLIALNDIGPGDGPTMVIPGSHKSNLAHPLAGDYARGDRMDDLPGAIPVHLRAGDALLLVDSLMHGAASRTNDGERRLIILRYGPCWGRTRFGYQYSRELLDRLSAPRRRILEPVPPVTTGENRIPREARQSP